MAQVVGAELELETVAAEGPGQPHHTGVVDQQIEPSVALTQFVAGPEHRAEVSEVEVEQIHRATSGGGGEQLLAGPLALGGGAAAENHRGTPGQQGAGALQAQTTAGAGDQHQATGLVGDVGSGPGHNGRERKVAKCNGV